MQQDVGGGEGSKDVRNPLLTCRCLYKTETSYLFVACMRNIYNMQLHIKM